MSRLSEYRDAVFTNDFNPDDYINRTLGGGGSTTKETTPWAGTPLATLHTYYRDGRISQADYQAELTSRGWGSAAIQDAIASNRPQEIQRPTGAPGVGAGTEPDFAGVAPGASFTEDSATFASRARTDIPPDVTVAGAVNGVKDGAWPAEVAYEYLMQTHGLNDTQARNAFTSRGVAVPERGGLTTGATGGPGTAGGQAGGKEGEPALSIEQQQEQNRTARDAQQQQAVQLAQQYAASNPGWIANGTRLMDTNTGQSFEPVYSKEYGWDLQPVQGNRSALDPYGTDAVKALGISRSASFDANSNRVTSAGTLSPEETGQIVARGGLSAAADRFPGLGPVALNAALGVSSPLGPINPADLPNETSNLSNAQQYKQIYDNYVNQGMSPQEADYRARVQRTITDIAEKTLGLDKPPMDQLLAGASPDLYSGQAAGNARMVLPGGEEAPLFGGSLGMAVSPTDPYQTQRVAQALQQGGYAGAIENLQGPDVTALAKASNLAQQQAGSGSFDYAAFAQDRGYRVVANPNPPPPFAIMGPDGSILGTYDSQSQAQTWAGITAYRNVQAAHEANKARINAPVVRTASTPRTTNGGGSSRPDRPRAEPLPPVQQPGPPNIVPPNYGGGPVIYQPLQPAAAQASTASALAPVPAAQPLEPIGRRRDRRLTELERMVA